MKKVLLVVLVLAVASFAWAANPAAPHATKRMTSPTAFGPHTLKGTYNNNGFNGTAVAAATYTAVDAGGTIKCPGTSAKTCLVHLESHVQIGDFSASDNPMCITLAIDGVNASCYYVSTVTTGFYLTQGHGGIVGTTTGGAHTVQTIIYVGGGASDQGYYDSTYTVYQP